MLLLVTLSIWLRQELLREIKTLAGRRSGNFYNQAAFSIIANKREWRFVNISSCEILATSVEVADCVVSKKRPSSTLDTYILIS